MPGVSHDRITRRRFLRSLALLLPAGLALGLAAPPLRIPGRLSIIGESQGGRDLTIRRFGDGDVRLFILGGQHGGPEANTVELAQMLMEHFSQNPAEIPAGVAVEVMPEGNPDGLATGSRQYLSGVDPNRNWGGPDWRPDGFDSNAQFRVGIGGAEPFSEPETRALRAWLQRVRPAFVVNYHSAGGFMFGGGEGRSEELSNAYAQASGYPRPTAQPGGGSPLPYRATGSMNVWLRTAGIAGCLIELTSARAPEFERNLAGVRAVLQKLRASGR